MHRQRGGVGGREYVPNERIPVAFGVLCQGFVVVAKLPLTPPILRVVVVKVEFVDADV